MSTNPNIKIVKKYRGKTLTNKYLKRHPDVLAKLPSKEEFDEAYRALKVKTSKNKTSILEMSESGINTIMDIE